MVSSGALNERDTVLLVIALLLSLVGWFKYGRGRS